MATQHYMAIHLPWHRWQGGQHKWQGDHYMQEDSLRRAWVSGLSRSHQHPRSLLMFTRRYKAIHMQQYGWQGG
jgi:hypothetical protein